jgi:hypothetical protein
LFFSLIFMILLSTSTRRPKNGFPIIFHAHHRPAPRQRPVERLVELAERRVAVVGSLALGIGVMDEAHETGSASRCRPLQHLLVAVR